DIAQIVGRFLLRHRGHEIRVMPEQCNELLKGGDDKPAFRKLEDDISFENYLKEPVDPDPDPDQEWENLPTLEAERLYQKVMASETLPRDDRRGFTAEDAERMRRKYGPAKAAPPGKPAK